MELAIPYWQSKLEFGKDLPCFAHQAPIQVSQEASWINDDDDEGSLNNSLSPVVRSDALAARPPGIPLVHHKYSCSLVPIARGKRSRLKIGEITITQLGDSWHLKVFAPAHAASLLSRRLNQRLPTHDGHQGGVERGASHGGDDFPPATLPIQRQSKPQERRSSSMRCDAII